MSKSSEKERELLKRSKTRIILVVTGTFIALSIGALALAWSSMGSVLDPVPKASATERSSGVLRSMKTLKEQDPFAGHTWHAIDSTWPGTIVFTAKDKSVVLRPLGAPEIQGTYSYEIKHASSHTLAAAKLVEGRLRMTNTIGQVSESNFRLEDGDKLTLIYMTGQRPEKYARLTEEDVKDQKEQLEQLLRSGKLEKFQLPPSLQTYQP